MSNDQPINVNYGGLRIAEDKVLPYNSAKTIKIKRTSLLRKIIYCIGFVIVIGLVIWKCVIFY
jgi:hypothetical protein